MSSDDDDDTTTGEQLGDEFLVWKGLLNNYTGENVFVSVMTPYFGRK